MLIIVARVSLLRSWSYALPKYKWRGWSYALPKYKWRGWSYALPKYKWRGWSYALPDGRDARMQKAGRDVRVPDGRDARMQKAGRDVRVPRRAGRPNAKVRSDSKPVASVFNMNFRFREKGITDFLHAIA
jgi:hypothetical protein